MTLDHNRRASSRRARPWFDRNVSKKAKNVETVPREARGMRILSKKVFSIQMLKHVHINNAVCCGMILQTNLLFGKK